MFLWLKENMPYPLREVDHYKQLQVGLRTGILLADIISFALE